jgi:hypothetical protein
VLYSSTGNTLLNFTKLDVCLSLKTVADLHGFDAQSAFCPSNPAAFPETGLDLPVISRPVLAFIHAN